MAVLAENGRTKLWFGTVDRMEWVATPNRGADVSPEGWDAGGPLLNGGAYQLNSFNSAKNYVFEWPESSSREAAQLMKSYADGTYGRGLIYFVDPLCYTTNILPAMWADPSMGIGSEAGSLVPGVVPVSTPTTGNPDLRMPVKAAYYNLNNVGPAGNAILVPKYRNLFTNPRLLGSGTYSEVRRNMHPNPNPWSSLTTFGYAAAPSEAEMTQDSTGAVRWTITASGLTGRGVRFSADSMSTISGETYRVQIRVRASRELTGRIRVRGGTESELRTFSTLWQWIDADVVAGTAASDFWSGLIVNCDQGDWIEVARVCVEHNPMVRGSWFTGEGEGQGVGGTSTDPDFRARWLGAPNESESVLEVENVRGIAPVYAIAGVSTWEGKPAIRIIPTTPGYAASVGFSGTPSLRIGTLMGTLHLPQDVTASGALGNHLRVTFPTGEPAVSDPVPDTPGSYPLRLQWNRTELSSTERLFNGRPRGGSSVWWTDIGLFAGFYPGPAFNGGSGAIYVAGETLATDWAGAVDNSTSVAGTWEFSGTPHLDDSNSVFLPVPQGYSLRLAGFYSSGGSGGVYASPVGVGGTTLTSVTEVEPSEDLSHRTILVPPPGVVGYRLWVGKFLPGDSYVILSALSARLAPIGQPTRGPEYWVGGQGHSGCRFSGKPTYINQTGVGGGQVSYAASFREVGSWVVG